MNPKQFEWSHLLEAPQFNEIGQVRHQLSVLVLTATVVEGDRQNRWQPSLRVFHPKQNATECLDSDVWIPRKGLLGVQKRKIAGLVTVRDGSNDPHV